MTAPARGPGFGRDNFAVLQKIRKGQVVTYGEIALEAGDPALS